ncbi:MAG TPA: MarR family transcriptional regulator [Actinomycetota bacterium]|nr:MarR family transcriptional regulator [Actinomycetota bacterium]
MTSPSDTATIERLRLTVMRLARRLRQQAEPGVTPSMLSALATLERRPATLGELADAERVSAPTMTRIVARLEEEGLVERARHEQDGRIVRLRLSDKGVRLVERNRSRKDAYLAARLEGTDIQEVERCLLLLESLLEDPS